MRVLVAEDDKVSRRLISTGLKCLGYEPVGAEDGLDALERLAAPAAPNLVILDWNMPRLDGRETCRRIRARPEAPYRYVMMLTSRREKSDMLAGFQAGADDYLVKPVQLDELAGRLGAGERVLRLQADLAATRDVFREQAHHDALTGLLNRAGAMPLLERLASEERALSLVFCDVDSFKGVNDAHGHAMGDIALREIAERLRARLRPGDTVCRYGGEDFLLVLPDCEPLAAAVVAERLRSDICGSPVYTPRGALSISCSFGVAGREGGNEATAAFLLAMADRALCRAKRGGRNCVEMIDATVLSASPPPVSTRHTLPPALKGPPIASAGGMRSRHG
jgi:two-component system, cell cycle response regulator